MCLPPPVPPHAAPTQQQGQEMDLESHITDLEQFIESGNIELLDSMVDEFAKQCVPEATNSPTQELTILPSTVSQL